MDFINKYDTFIFDLDGTVYVENKLIPKADTTINELQDLGKNVCFVSNKTTGTPDEYYSFLTGKGVRIKKERIITPGFPESFLQSVKNLLLNICKAPDSIIRKNRMRLIWFW